MGMELFKEVYKDVNAFAFELGSKLKNDSEFVNFLWTYYKSVSTPFMSDEEFNSIASWSFPFAVSDNKDRMAVIQWAKIIDGELKYKLDIEKKHNNYSDRRLILFSIVARVINRWLSSGPITETAERLYGIYRQEDSRIKH